MPSHTHSWLAASAGQYRCVDELLAMGADVSLRDGDGLDAAARAAQKGHLAIAQKLAGHTAAQQDL